MMEVRRLTFLLKLSCIRLFWEGKGRLERGESGGCAKCVARTFASRLIPVMT